MATASRAPAGILTINAGSSSLKFALFRAGQSLVRAVSGHVERIGLPDTALTVTDVATQQTERGVLHAPDHAACVQPANLHVRGYKEEGTATTPFDMAVLNDLDRLHLVADVIDRVPRLGTRATYAQQAIRDNVLEHKQYIAEHGEDMPEIRTGQWGGRESSGR